MSSTRQLSFSGGEIAPYLHGRVDLIKYTTGLKTCENFMVMRHGGVTNRSGTGFVNEVKDSSKTVRLIPFIFTSNQIYVLEFGNQYMRVRKDHALLTLAAKNITGATQANPCVVTIASHGYTTGDEVYIESVGGMTELNGRNFKVGTTATNTFELKEMDGTNLDSTGYGAYTSGGTAAKVYEIATPYLEADLSTLQHVQSAGTIIITHEDYAPRELTRSGDTAWSLDAIVFGATIAAPTNLVSSSVGTAYYYVVTAVDLETGEESLASNEAGSSGPNQTLTWTQVASAGYYNVYKEINNRFGWIGTAGQDASPSFQDQTYTPDAADIPPEDRQPFNATSDYPAAVAYYQQRLVFGNTINNPESVYTSRTGLPKNFMVSTPIQDDDAITFALVGRRSNIIKHLLDVGRLLVFTSSGEWSILGDGAGILTPTAINPKQYTANGSGNLAPIVVGNNALYIQARGSIIRDLSYDFQVDGYKGNEVTIFASHLFDNYTLVDWAYQQIPHSVVWAVRDDGVLLGLTYVAEHQVMGWHKHTFDGTVENVCVIPGANEDILYMVIKRTVNGKSVRYVEYMKTRQIDLVEDMVFVDSSLSYDGRHGGSTTMTLSGGTTWAFHETITLTASASTFVSTDVGNQIFLTGSDGTVVKFTIQGYTSGTVVTGQPNKTVPSGMRSVAMATWSKAVDELGGLWHLEGKSVSVFGDGYVVANPNNDAYTTVTVSSGKVTLDKPYAVIHVGLPITSKMETLALDNPQVPMADRKKNVQRLYLNVEASAGIWAGIDSTSLTEFKLDDLADLDAPMPLKAGVININITSDWNDNGQIYIEQIDPLPVSILSVIPSGYI